MYEVIKDRKIRMAIVGCGRISKNHFGSIEKHADNKELANISKAKFMLGYKPKFSIRDGMDDVFNWYLKFLS